MMVIAYQIRAKMSVRRFNVGPYEISFTFLKFQFSANIIKSSFIYSVDYK